ncbi:hypothetical protein J3D56_000264 [Erwinia persicina]|jgi:hypothetical protein|uniref:DUF1471 domain-containing protein n=2 Tax=Erwinia TaxID=551 RepID=A0ABV4E334_9GAMM|nr:MULTISPECIES: DUF1471 domain-containing protein [Erwinia]MCP1436828.1 hypothetical protein [Erwinia persicina]MDN8540200.1 DUF1471 domain-containing protein [Erwinia sp. BC051422]
MKAIKKLVVFTALSLISSVSFAQSVTACASTLDAAEAQISAQAKAANASYRITEANYNNGVHMTAVLSAKE